MKDCVLHRKGYLVFPLDVAVVSYLIYRRDMLVLERRDMAGKAPE